MNIGEIVKDSLRYPFSDWKKILILGIIVFFSIISSIKGFIALLGITNIALISLLVIIELLIGFLVSGYCFRIIKSSLAGEAKLPKFNTWFELFINGIKVSIASIVYVIPSILIILIFAALSKSNLGIGSNQVFDGNLLGNVVHIITGSGIHVITSLGTGILGLIAILYTIIVYPLLQLAIANMANNESKLKAAFRLREIFNKIGTIGWLNLIKWYLATGIIYLVIVISMAIIFIIIFNPIQSTTVRLIGMEVLASLILLPYLYMYFARSVALFYRSEKVKK